MHKRKHVRIEKCLPISVTSLHGAPSDRRAALSADLSPAGFCLETTTLRRAGEVVSGYVLHGNKELTFTGKVKWVAAGNPMASTWHRMGVEFMKVSPGLRALLSMLANG
jgi:hypothetical protein